MPRSRTLKTKNMKGTSRTQTLATRILLQDRPLLLLDGQRNIRNIRSIHSHLSLSIQTATLGICNSQAWEPNTPIFRAPHKDMPLRRDITSGDFHTNKPLKTCLCMHLHLNNQCQGTQVLLLTLNNIAAAVGDNKVNVTNRLLKHHLLPKFITTPRFLL